MGWMILKQPNGYYARFSSIVDTFTHVNLTWGDAMDVCIDECGKLEAVGKLKRADQDADRTNNPRTGDGLNRWRECLETVELIHGKREAKRFVRDCVNSQPA